MSEDRGGGGWGIRPAQTSRRVETEATEHKLPIKQTVSGALALCIVVALFVFILALIDLPAILCVALALATLRVLRGIEFVAWWSAGIMAAVLIGGVLLITTVAADVSIGGELLALLRSVWLPTDYHAAWLQGIDARLLLWSRGTLTAMALCVMFFACNLAYRMAIEVFNPNWPPTFTAALAELGPLWWTWKPKPSDPAPLVQKVIEVRKVKSIDGTVLDDTSIRRNGDSETFAVIPFDLGPTPLMGKLAHALNEGENFSQATGKRCGWSNPKWRRFCIWMLESGYVEKVTEKLYALTTPDGEEFMSAYGYERQLT